MNSSTVREQYTCMLNTLVSLNIEGADLIARSLLADVLVIPLNQLVLHYADILERKDQEVLNTYLEKIYSGVPLAYVLGYQDFFGMKIQVNTTTLIPRPETEELIELILADNVQHDMLLDVGTGSGCIPCVLSKYMQYKHTYACDISKDALDVAVANARQHAAPIQFLHMDCTSPLFQRELLNIVYRHSIKTLLVTANLPYIPTEEMSLLDSHVMNHEPASALDGGKGGTEIIARLLICLDNVYNAGVRVKVYLEIDPSNVDSLDEFIKKYPHIHLRYKRDISGHIRFAICEFD